MLRSSCARSILAALTIIALPPNAAAQADPASIEGIEWHLASYDSGGGPVSVPWTIDATLLLEAGTASGSTGCNTFVGTYTLAAGGLSFDESIAATEMACVGDADVVEQGYMSILPATATWAAPADGVLQLDDAAGVTSLVFEQAVSSLTASDIAGMEARSEALQDEIDQLEARLRNIRIGTLRDRISELESTVASLQRQVQELRSSGSGASSGGFNDAERMLLEGIPGPIRGTCAPRRSQNPTGTIAAVQCKPAAAVVRDMAYYLMPGAVATSVFERRMKQYGVNDGEAQCRNGTVALAYDTPGPGASGCYVDADGRANLRVVEAAAGCNQLEVGDRKVRIPAIYVAVLGNDDDIRALARWAEPRLGRSLLTQEIERPDAPVSPRCPT